VKSHRFLREADAEFHEQIAYLDKQAAGLGDKLIADVEATMTDIRTYPESGAPISPTLRKRYWRKRLRNLGQ
jgi:hypothetical protein